MQGNVTIVVILLVLGSSGIGLYLLLKHIMTVLVTRAEVAKELENGQLVPGVEVEFAAAGPPPAATAGSVVRAASSNAGADISSWARDTSAQTHLVGGSKDESKGDEEPNDALHGPPDMQSEFQDDLRAQALVLGYTDEQHLEALAAAKPAAEQAWVQVHNIQSQQVLDSDSTAAIEDIRHRLFWETGRQYYWNHLMNLAMGPAHATHQEAIHKVVESKMQTRGLWEAFHARMAHPDLRARQDGAAHHDESERSTVAKTF
ncbi:hypothetical protein KEM52_001170 [Ascosphaera acerosa]|nr:hypothetical protein KEM52_001170 [Ascosphaera acerosa]